MSDNSCYPEPRHEEFLNVVYNVVLKRDPDPGAIELYTLLFRRGALTHAEFIQSILGSDEAKSHSAALDAAATGPAIIPMWSHFLQEF